MNNIDRNNPNTTGMIADDAKSRNRSTVHPTNSTNVSTTANDRTESPAATIRFCVGVRQAALAVKNGAKFIVSPGLDDGVVIWAKGNNIPVIPGCVTPTEIMKAISLGLKVVKFFPADVFGGIKAIKALSAPFGQVKFLPTGGVSAANLPEFVANKSIAAVGGSWVCKKDDIANHDWDKITALSAEAVKIIKETRV